MKILFVLNSIYTIGNGLSASARRTVQALREQGEEVRVLSGPNHNPEGPQPEYLLKDFYFPIFQPLIRAHGYQFSSTDVKVVEEAVRWADVVHMQEPFVLEIRTAKIARRLGKPVTGTYHLHPENIFYSLGMGGWKFPNQLMLKIWRDLCFKHWSHIQCPTRNVLERLKKIGCTNELHLISNGIIPDESIRQPQENHPYIVACIGRLTGEKDQITLLEAMKYCRHARDIQLIYAGRGPQEKKTRRIAARLYKKGILAYNPSFEFMNREELRQLGAKADLFIHCAIAEVEGLSIMEAMQQGGVPVIAQGPITGACQFALDDRSLFQQHDARELAQKIDWWLDHPKELEEARNAYIESMKEYEIAKSARALIQMFQKAIDGK